MSDKKAIASMLASKATSMVQEIVRDNSFPNTMNPAEATKAINAIVFQDSILDSKRVWSVVLGVAGMGSSAIAAAMLVPEAKEVIGPYAPMIAAALGALASGLAGLSALLSKLFDPRPMR